MGMTTFSVETSSRLGGASWSQQRIGATGERGEGGGQLSNSGSECPPQSSISRLKLRTSARADPWKLELALAAQDGDRTCPLRPSEDLGSTTGGKFNWVVPARKCGPATTRAVSRPAISVGPYLIRSTICVRR